MNSKVPKYNNENDKVLFYLFDQRSGRDQVDPNNFRKENIQGVLENHFPGRNYKHFSPLFRRKARQYNLMNYLKGDRKQKSSG